MKTFASFYDIVEGVKDETGITNLVNRYNEISRLIVRAERDINPYAGHFIIKNVRYKKGTVNFNGTSIKIPADFIELMAVYDKSGPGRKMFEIRNSQNTHILICNGTVNESVVLRYWATQRDPEGYPYIPHNHFEAVVAFITWKFYSQRHFQNDGSLNNKSYYKDVYEQFARAARGEDFFPTAEQLKNMRSLKHIPMNYEIECDDCMCSCSVVDDTSPAEDLRKVWYWQEDSLVQQIVEDDVTDDFLKDKSTISYTGFQSGGYFNFPYIGRYGIAIKGGPKTPEGIVDTLGASIIDSVTYKYYEDRQMLVLISKNYVTPGTFFLKLTN